MPCALSVGTYGAIRKRSDNTVNLLSGNLDGEPVVFQLDQLTHDPVHGWGNYPKGVISVLKEMGHTITGFDMYVIGNLPSGAGLSSSASLTTLVTLALSHLFDLHIPPVERAIICQKAEFFNGVNCGIMDPFACALGQDDHAILLDCNTLEYKHIPLNLGQYQIVIANTNYKRGLADSKYNERRAECEEALADLQKVVDITALCDLTPQAFEQHKDAIQGELPRRRAEHAVYENFRTKEAARVMEEGKLEALQPLMRDSHLSLRDLYDVTGKALDLLTSAATMYGKQNPTSVVGTRMTGAGFGGCTVNIVHTDYIDDFTKTVGRKYQTGTETAASFYVAKVSGGAREI